MFAVHFLVVSILHKFREFGSVQSRGRIDALFATGVRLKKRILSFLPRQSTDTQADLKLGLRQILMKAHRQHH